MLALPTSNARGNDAKSSSAFVPVAAERPAEKSDNAAPDQPTSKAAAHADQSPAKVAEKTVLPLSKKAGKTTASARASSRSRSPRATASVL